MTPRERILAVLDRKPVDRIPFEIGGTDCSSVHALSYGKLRRAMGFDDEAPIDCGCLVQLIAEVDSQVMDALGVDAQPLYFHSQRTRLWQTPFGPTLRVPERFEVRTDDNGDCLAVRPDGTAYAKMAATGHYFDPFGTPLAAVESPAQLDAFDALFERWDYSSVYDESLEDLAARARTEYQATDRAVVALWRLHYLQSGQIMRGYEQFLVDLMVEKPLAHALLAKLHEVYMRRVDAFLKAFGDAIDVVFLTDDLGTQLAGMISPAVYREMIYPYISELVGRIKAAGKRVLMHSCGAVAEFIPMMIEMGIDALNPVQVSAAGMNPADLVRQYGRDIAFWGGGCDSQHALNAADPAAVKADVARRLKEFGDSAHLVFTQVHNIQYDVPAENILAMHEEFSRLCR